MANPNVPQGTLNKARATVNIVDLPALNIGIFNLNPDGVSLGFEGDASGYPQTMVGAVPSPNATQIGRATVSILKTQGLSDQWKSQIELNTSIGDFVITPDASTLSPYYLYNGTIITVEEYRFNGTTPAMVIRLQGIYQINSSMFDGT